MEIEFDKDSKGALAAKAFADAVNGFSEQDYQQFALELCLRTHRTIQQNAMRAIWAAIKKWADVGGSPSGYDLRNERTVKACIAIVNSVPEVFLPYV